MSSSNKYSPEIWERTVRMVLEHQSPHDSQWAAIGSIAETIGCRACRQYGVNRGVLRFKDHFSIRAAFGEHAVRTQLDSPPYTVSRRHRQRMDFRHIGRPTNDYRSDLHLCSVAVPDPRTDHRHYWILSFVSVRGLKLSLLSLPT